jgi:hypothetical protein
MPSAKELHVAPISHEHANALVKRLHYSHKVARNSQLHLGVFLAGKLEGAMQFGPSLDKEQMLSLVRGTKWNGFIELNRMAFSERLPRNSESRAISVALRLMRSSYPHLDWVVSFADATQCGDGAIYRASGFVLTKIGRNETIWEFPDGERAADIAIKTGHDFQRRKFGREFYGAEAMREAVRRGAKKIPGFQLRYIYFLNPSARERLAVPVIPFSRIADMHASMYRGQIIERGQKANSGSPGAAAEHSRPPRSSDLNVKAGRHV